MATRVACQGFLHTNMLVSSVRNGHIGDLKPILHAFILCVYTMRFPYVALAIRPNANEMYMQRK